MLSLIDFGYTSSNRIFPDGKRVKYMTRTPPRMPVPARDQRTLRQPPLYGTTSPASGLPASHTKKSSRSSSVQSLSASATKVGVSAMVYIAQRYGKDG